MGSASSKHNDAVTLSKSNKGGKDGLHTIRDENEIDSPNNDQNKKKVLQDSNKRLAAKTDHTFDNGYPGGPLIAVQSVTNEYIEIDRKSTNEAKLESVREEKILEKSKREAERKQIEEDSLDKARVESLKQQIEKRVAGLKKKCEEDARKFKVNGDLEIALNVIDGLESTLRRFQDENNFESFPDRREERSKLCRQYDEMVTKQSKFVLRISELAGVQLKHNNPNIADLSDENRASKLFAKFSELYDNECTDLHEVYSEKLTKNIEEKTIVCHIRDCLKLSYQKCQWTAEQQRKQLVTKLFKDENIQYSTTNVELQLRIKEFQKNVAKLTIPHVQSKFHREMINTKQSKIIERIKPKNNPLHPRILAFLDKAIELCWYTQIQDPPVVLDFKQRSDIGDYRSYTKSGTQIEYIVWPVLLLHEDGPVLYRGIAQFKTGDDGTIQKKDSNSSTMNKEDKDSRIKEQKLLNESNTYVGKHVSKSPRAEIKDAGEPSEW